MGDTYHIALTDFHYLSRDGSSQFRKIMLWKVTFYTAVPVQRTSKRLKGSGQLSHPIATTDYTDCTLYN